MAKEKILPTRLPQVPPENKTSKWYLGFDLIRHYALDALPEGEAPGATSSSKLRQR